VLLFALHLLAFLAGLWLVIRTIVSAIRIFVVPRASADRLAGLVFVNFRRAFDFVAHRLPDYESRDRVLAFYAPTTLVALPAVYLSLISLGFTAMYWAFDVTPLYDAFWLSGSSLLTLGFRNVDTLPQMILSFSEAAIGLILYATLIAYLPTMYNAFSARERMVSLLEVRAGRPPWAVILFERYTRLERLHELGDLWVSWEEWFAELDETHTSLAALVFFRSPSSHLSWITSAGAILDAAALRSAVIDLPRDVGAEICIRAGYLALQHIAGFFGFRTVEFESQEEALAAPLHITRADFDAACARLSDAGVPLKADREQAWVDFHGWRANYDAPLVFLSRLVMAPPAPWIDTALDVDLPPMVP
jgi:hypothetical protein